MNKNIRIPFTRLNKRAWERLLIVAICSFYLFQISYRIVTNGFLESIGNDYLAFWSAGKIADEKGYTDIYNLENLRDTQIAERERVRALSDITNSFPEILTVDTLPVAILPIFIIPFQFLSKLDSSIGYMVWALLNLIVLITYLLFYTRKVCSNALLSSSGKRILLITLIAYPVFQNFIEGQIKVFLVICIGEFVRFALAKKPIHAGVWLGGLLLNPQLLILVIPAFLIFRNWKIIFGFILTSAVVLTVSYFLSGFEGIKSMAGLWIKFVPGIATNNPQAMMNWRMLALQINHYSSSSLIGWTIAGVGIFLTLFLIIRILQNRPLFGSDDWLMVMLGIFAATCAITWHSHVTMAIVLIPILIYAAQKKLISERLLFFWVSFTPLLCIVEYILFALIILRIIPAITIDINLMGLSGLILNLILVFTVFKYVRQVSLAHQKIKIELGEK